MENRLGNVLSQEDWEKVNALFPSKEDKGKPWEEREADVIRSVEYIRENYEVMDFPLEDFKKRKYVSFYLYPSKKSKHAGRIYIKGVRLLARKADGDLKTNYQAQEQAYYQHQIQRLEKTKDVDYQTRALVFLGSRADAYIDAGDYRNFRKTCQEYVNRKAKLSKRHKDQVARAIANVDEDFASKTIEEVSKVGSRIYGDDPHLIQALWDAMDYADDDQPCLILGETGTGKEIIANLIHKISSRRKNRFWAVNCGGLTESLFNSLIQGVHWSAATDIGTTLGAFLTATGRDDDQENKGYFLDWERDSKGRKIGGKIGRKEIFFKIGGKTVSDPSFEDLKPVTGTLFLDEINSIPLGLQSVLLRAIQEREVTVVGEGKTRKYSAKVVCASNEEIGSREAGDRFRPDLYYRIGQGIIRMTALRDMAGSIEEIATEMINDKAKKEGYQKEIEIVPKALELLKTFSWPGNHRQLENVIYRAYKKIVLNDGNKLLKKYLSFDQKETDQATPAVTKFFEGKTYDQVEKAYLDYLVDQGLGNKAEIQRLAGFKSKSPVYRLFKKHNLTA